MTIFGGGFGDSAQVGCPNKYRPACVVLSERGLYSLKGGVVIQIEEGLLSRLN
jgi:hypothetical protein